MSGALVIREPGLLAHIQDRGRFGHQRSGVPVSGALDPDALRLANALVGNPPDTAALEIRYTGPEIECESESARIAIVGARVSARIVGEGEPRPLAQDRSATLRRGEVLRVGPLRDATTAILAVAGGLDIPPVLGSRATFARSRLGGLDGRPLAAGDRVPLLRDAAPEGPDRALPKPYDLAQPAAIRVVPGPQRDHFTDAAWETFLATAWTVSKNADRMGLRLEGPELEHADGYNIVSDGIVTGAIQVPGTRLPIVLLADRQTSGGYPKIATAITADLPALGRLGPGATLRFAAVDAAEGARIARERARAIDRLVRGIAEHAPPGEVDVAALWRENLIQPPITEAD